MARFFAWLDQLSPLQEKWLLIVLMTTYTGIGYFFLGLTTNPLRASSLMTPLDAALPFVPHFIQPYAVVYTAAFYPAFVVVDRFLFRRGIQAYLMAMTIIFACYAVFPVTALGLRPRLDGYDLQQFDFWCLKVLYTLDPPYNLFPSMHLAVAVIATLFAWKARPLYGWLAAGPAVGVAAAIVLVKQHFLADGAAGVLVAWACYRAYLQSWSPSGQGRVASTWRGPWGYLAFHGLVLLGFYWAFLKGWQPWA